MNITQVSLAIRHGGAERIALDLHRAHREAGHNASLLVGRLNTPEPGALLIDHTAHRGPITRALGRIDPRIARPLQWLKRRRGHDIHDQPATAQLLNLPPHPTHVLHLHALHGGYFDLRELPRLSRDVPTVLTLHDSWMLTGGATHAHRGGPPSAIAQQNRAIKRRVLADCRLHVAAPSQWMLDQIPGSMLEPAVIATHVVPNNVSPSVFHPNLHPGDRAAARKRLGLAPNGFRALFVAFAAKPHHPCKDLTTALHAINASQTPHLTLDIVGTAGRNTAHLHFHGPVHDRQRMADHYRAADVFIHAAHAENYPTVILEALACHTPVIATAVGGIPEQIQHNTTGLLVPPQNAPAMARAIDTLLANPNQRTAMARAIAQRPIHDTAATYRHVYQTAMASPAI
ncbi:MAG: glycosyltransferase [Algisphaera sp.]